jgi:hypothetical protein
LGNKGEVVVDLEKEKAVSFFDWTLHRTRDLTLGSARSIIAEALHLAEKGEDDRTLGI